MGKRIINDLLLFGLVFMMIAFTSCKKDEEDNATDKELYDMATTVTGFTWYKNSVTLMGKSSGSGHNQPYLRTRFNIVAAGKHNVSGKVEEGTVFPDESLIVKELFCDASTFDKYAILYKKAGIRMLMQTDGFGAILMLTERLHPRPLKKANHAQDVTGRMVILIVC